MIDRFLRRLSVRQRIFGIVALLTLVLVVLIPLFFFYQNWMVSRRREIGQTVADIDHLLLQAAWRVSSSRVELLLYMQHATDSPDATLDNVEQAQTLLEEVQLIIPQGETVVSLPQLSLQASRVAETKLALTDYQTLIGRLQSANLAGDVVEVARLERQALELGEDISTQLEVIVDQSQEQLDVTRVTSFAQVQGRMAWLVLGYVLLVVGVLTPAVLAVRTVTTVMDDLRRGCVALRQGDLNAPIPVRGDSEPAFVAETINSLAAQLADSYQELEQRVTVRISDVRRRVTYLQAIIDVNRATTEILDVDTLLQQAVDAVLRRFPLTSVALYLLDEVSEEAVLRARAGGGEALSPNEMVGGLSPNEMVGEGDHPLLDWALNQGQARLALHSREGPATSQAPHSDAAIPLRLRDRVTGALRVQSEEADALDEEVVDLLQVMADLLAVTIENARRYAEVQRALEAARLAYRGDTQAGWAQRLQNRPLSYRVDARGEVREGRELAEAPAGLSNIPLTDEVTTLTLPLTVRGITIGALRLQKPGDAAPWTERQVSLLQTIVEQLGLALDSARLFEDSRRREAVERMTREVTLRMREPVELESVLETAASEIRRALGLEDLVIHLTVPEGDGAH